MSEPIQPNIGDDLVPMCPGDRCCQYDGKRCRLIGFRPGYICEPAVARMAQERRALLAACKLARARIADIALASPHGDVGAALFELVEIVGASINPAVALSEREGGG